MPTTIFFKTVIVMWLISQIFWVNATEPVTELANNKDTFIFLNTPIDGKIAQQQTAPKAIEQIEAVWLEARDAGKSMMLVLGSDACDRCVLLQRYIQDDVMRARLDSRFVVLNIDVAHSDFSIDIESAGETDWESLPAIVLLDTSMPFEQTMRADQLLAFLPEPYEPLYQWIENILYYTERSIATL